MITRMKRTITPPPDPLQGEMENFQRDRTARLPTSTVAQAAVREYLQRRGYGKPTSGGGFHITPAQQGSGTSHASIDHDRYIAEATRR